MMYFPREFDRRRAIELAELIYQAYARLAAYPEGITRRAVFLVIAPDASIWGSMEISAPFMKNGLSPLILLTVMLRSRGMRFRRAP